MSLSVGGSLMKVATMIGKEVLLNLLPPSSRRTGACFWGIFQYALKLEDC